MKKREQKQPALNGAETESEEIMEKRITEQERKAEVEVLAQAPAGQPPFKHKRPAIAEGNLKWLSTMGYIDGDFNFTDKAKTHQVVKVKVLVNTSEFGRGVKGQFMYVPTAEVEVSAKDKRFTGDFEF